MFDHSTSDLTCRKLNSSIILTASNLLFLSQLIAPPSTLLPKQKTSESFLFSHYLASISSDHVQLFSLQILTYIHALLATASRCQFLGLYTVIIHLAYCLSCLPSFHHAHSLNHFSHSIYSCLYKIHILSCNFKFHKNFSQFHPIETCRNACQIRSKLE